MHEQNYPSNIPSGDKPEKPKKEPVNFWKSVSALLFIVLAVMVISRVDLGSGVTIDSDEDTAVSLTDELFIEDAVLPQEGVEIPIEWGDFGKQMLDSGVIDEEAFLALYDRRGGLDDEMTGLLYGENNGRLTITAENSGYLLNLLWAFGLGNKNDILESGPITTSGDAGRFAATGGWSLATGDSMDHFSMHSFVSLTEAQQQLVEEVSSNIYRPCCGNSTFFPDCNHGMAMLGLLEIMASQGMSAEDMYDYALKVNSFWFPSTYLTIAKYMGEQGVAWTDVDSKEMLGNSYSSSAGYKSVLAKVEPSTSSGGGGCGI
ncbi:MAG: hypothetical protein Q8P30_01160 [Candidatus Uhrbacteria bacterium]|nr:hypothetical protein [Candidatus Uhrbacteria bacterium]